MDGGILREYEGSDEGEGVTCLLFLTGRRQGRSWGCPNPKSFKGEELLKEIRPLRREGHVRARNEAGYSKEDLTSCLDNLLPVQTTPFHSNYLPPPPFPSTPTPLFHAKGPCPDPYI